MGNKKAENKVQNVHSAYTALQSFAQGVVCHKIENSMTIEEILKHDLVKLPKNWKTLGYSSYYECVVDEGLKYNKLLEKLDEKEFFYEDKYLGKVTKSHLLQISYKFYEMVIKSLQIYLNDGDPHKSYTQLNNFFTSKSKSEIGKELLFYLEFDHVYPIAYRLRIKDGATTLKDLFHVPFHLRQKINSFRYSIPGYPTLYLSNSIFLAYKELNNPDYDNLYVSKFYHSEFYNKNESLLNMGNFPPWGHKNLTFKFLARWILTMACSIKVGHPNDPFKYEYILPQMLFQWVKNNYTIGKRKIIGVKYSSTKIDSLNENHYGFFYNTAIPIHSSSKEGFCNVRANQFYLTKPIKFTDALKSNIEAEQIGQVKFIELNGAKVSYTNTDFGKIEQLLDTNPYSQAFHVDGKRI